MFVLQNILFRRYIIYYNSVSTNENSIKTCMIGYDSILIICILFLRQFGFQYLQRATFNDVLKAGADASTSAKTFPLESNVLVSMVIAPRVLLVMVTFLPITEFNKPCSFVDTYTIFHIKFKKKWTNKTKQMNKIE